MNKVNVNLYIPDLQTLTNFAWLSPMLLCYHALTHFFSNFKHFHYFELIFFNYSCNYTSSNLWLYINTRCFFFFLFDGRYFWTKNIKSINQWHTRRTISCNIAVSQTKVFHLSPNHAVNWQIWDRNFYFHKQLHFSFQHQLLRARYKWQSQSC